MSLLRFSTPSKRVPTKIKNIILPALQKKINVKYQVKVGKPSDDMQKKTFVETINKLKEIDQRREDVYGLHGIDLSDYDQEFYDIIDNLLTMVYNKKQRTVIDLFLYSEMEGKDELQEKEWDGKIQIVHRGKELSYPFTTVDHLWDLVKLLKD